MIDTCTYKLVRARKSARTERSYKHLLSYKLVRARTYVRTAKRDGESDLLVRVARIEDFDVRKHQLRKSIGIRGARPEKAEVATGPSFRRLDREHRARVPM